MRVIFEHAMAAIRAGAAAVTFQQAGTAVARRRDDRRMGTGETNVERDGEEEQRQQDQAVAQLREQADRIEAKVERITRFLGDRGFDRRPLPNEPDAV